MRASLRAESSERLGMMAVHMGAVSIGSFPGHSDCLRLRSRSSQIALVTLRAKSDHLAMCRSGRLKSRGSDN